MYHFGGCHNLKSINVNENNTKYMSIDGDREGLKLIQYPCGKSVNYTIIPNNVITIGSSAFEGCNELTSITISSTLFSIEDYAFGGLYIINNSDLSTGSIIKYW